MVHVECVGTSTNLAGITDDGSNTYTKLLDVAVNGHSSIWEAVAGTAGTRTVTINPAGSPACTSINFSLDSFTGVTAIGNTNSNVNTACTAPCTDTVSLTTVAGSAIYEGYEVYGAHTGGSGTCPVMSTGSSQTVIDTLACQQPSGTVAIAGTTAYSFPITGTNNRVFSYSLASETPPSASGHMLVELKAVAGGGGTSGTLTACFGNCGNPAVTLINANATKQINFNQSITIFYEFQAQLNGAILNVTTNLGIATSSSQVLTLGIYTANCAAGLTPFSNTCQGLAARSFTAGASPKGQFVMPQTTTQNLAVTTGEWIGISFSAVLSGVIVNETNAVCGGSQCQNPPGLLWTTGNTPPTIANSQACTTSGSPCNFSGIGQTGLWTFIIGNTVVAPPTPTVTGCVNNFAQLDCLLPALSNGSCLSLTPGCQTAGSLFWILILTVLSFFVVTIGFSSAHVTRFIAAGDVFMFFFLTFFFMFAGVGLILSFVIIFFLFIGATVFSRTARNYF